MENRRHAHATVVLALLFALPLWGCGSKAADVPVDDPESTTSADAPASVAAPGSTTETGLATSGPSPVSTTPSTGEPAGGVLSEEDEARMAAAFKKAFDRMIRMHVIREKQVADAVFELRSAGPEMAAYLMKLADGEPAEPTPYHWALLCGALVDLGGEAGRAKVTAISRDEATSEAVREWARKALDGALAPER